MPEQRVNILIYRPDGTLIAQYLLGDGEHLIGRDINCPIYLDSEYISTNHAKLHLSAEGIYIEDLNSTSGTFLDGVTVRGKLRIKPGQVLQVGDLTVDLQPESVDNVGPGSRLGDGRYTLIRLLGRGGMGEVWLAKDEQLDEEVALKKIPHEVAADAMALADMRREVQKSRALTHQNIIRIHDLYVKPGEDPFISLEYVDGRDLTHIIATKTNGVFPWEEIKPLILQLCEALEYAHVQKTVHRDLKPANLMITRDSRLKLADFGIAATMVDSLSRSSIQGFVSGTTLYMSPQQMEGEAPQASDDIYAFGATLYELLTSRPPFYTGDMQHQVQQVIPKPMEQRLQEFGFTNKIPEYVQQLVMSCLAKEPEGRPKSMGAIRKWIKSEGEDKAAIPKPTTKTIKRAHTAREPLEPELTPAKKGAKYAVLAAVIAVVIGLGFWAKNQIEDLQPVQVSKLPKTKVKGGSPGGTNTPTVQPTNSPGRTGPGTVTPAPPPKIVVTPKPEPAKPTPPVTPPPVRPTTPPTASKGRLLWEFETGDWVTSSPAIGPDGTVYIGSWDAKIYALDGKTGAKKWDANVDMQVGSSPSIGPDGTIYVGAGRVFALDGKTGESLWKFVPGDNLMITPAIGSDGTIYVGASDNKVYALDGKSGAKKWEYRLDIHVTISPAIEADGTVYTVANGKVYALDGVNGAEKWNFDFFGGQQLSLSIGADGTFYSGALNGRIYAINGKTREKKWEFVSGKAIRSSPAIGPDGTVYIGSTDSKVYALNGKTGVKKWEFATGKSVESTPAIGADGTIYVGSGDKKVYALDGATGAKKWEFETGRDVVSSPAISPDGILYIGSKDKKVYALKTNSKGLAKSPWPMFGQNPQHTSRASSAKTSVAAPVSPEPATPESLKKGLTGYYPFNGNAKDESGNGNDGTLKEIVKFSNDRFGRSDSACIFDGELGYVAFPRGVAKDTQDTATVSLWFLMPDEGSVGHLFLSGGSVGSTQRVMTIEKSGKINASIGYPSASLEGAVAENGKWHHACLIYRTKIDTAELYLDGQLVAKNKKKYWLEGLPEMHHIAAFNTRTKCTMDDVRFYNRDLTAAEVKKLYDLERKKP